MLPKCLPKNSDKQVINLKNNKLCFDIEGGLNGKRVIAYDVKSSGKDNQMFEFTSDNMLSVPKANDKFVYVRGDEFLIGSKEEAKNSGGGSFFRVPVNYIFKNSGNGKCLSWAGERKQLKTEDCSDDDKFRWIHNPIGKSLRSSANHGFAVDIEGGTKGRKIIAWNYHGKENQQFNYEHKHIKSVATKGRLTAEGSDVVIKEDDGSDYQKWEQIFGFEPPKPVAPKEQPKPKSKPKDCECDFDENYMKCKCCGAPPAAAA